MSKREGVFHMLMLMFARRWLCERVMGEEREIMVCGG